MTAIQLCLITSLHPYKITPSPELTPDNVVFEKKTMIGTNSQDHWSCFVEVFCLVKSLHPIVFDTERGKMYIYFLGRKSFETTQHY